MKKQNYILFCFLFVLFLSIGITQSYASISKERTPSQEEALRWVKQEFTDFKVTLEKKMHSATATENFEAIYQAALKTGLFDPEKLSLKKSYYLAFGRTDSDQLFLQSVHNEVLRATSFFARKTNGFFSQTAKDKVTSLSAMLPYLSKFIPLLYFFITKLNSDQSCIFNNC